MLTAAALLVSATLAAPRHVADEPLFAPDKSLTVQRATRSATDFALEDWTVAMNGQEVPGEYLPKLGVEGRGEAELRTTDTYLASSDGKPTRVRRKFEHLSAKRSHTVEIDEVPRDASERAGTCALQGCVVLLDDGARGGERRKLEEGECEQALLDALTIDHDLTEFLPSDSTDAAWEVPASALNLFDERRGGIVFEYDAAENRQLQDPEQLARNVAGRWSVERGEAREEDGVRVLPLAVTGKLTSHSEIEGELEDVPVASGPTTERAELGYEVRGEILWNLERRVLHSASLEGLATMTYKTRTVQESQPGTPVYQQDMRFRGTLSLSIETTIDG